MHKIINKFDKASHKIHDKLKHAKILSGTSDIIVTRWKTGELRSTPFFVCFGHKAIKVKNKKVIVIVNDNQIQSAKFTINENKYLQPTKPSNQILQALNLKFGKNYIKFILSNGQFVESQIYLYYEDDKILVSDVDGTLTKSDKHGIIHNFLNKNYLHDGYSELIQKMDAHGYNVIWLTMRSFPLYHRTKDYIRDHTNVEGPLITAPQQFFKAFIKQVTNKTVDIKTNMINEIRQTFPPHINPFIGGLGNRQNDGIVYKKAGISHQNIYIINKFSEVCKINKTINDHITYKSMSEDIFTSFSHQSVDLFRILNNNQLEHKNVFTKTVKQVQISTSVNPTNQNQLPVQMQNQVQLI